MTYPGISPVHINSKYPQIHSINNKSLDIYYIIDPGSPLMKSNNFEQNHIDRVDEEFKLQKVG